MSDDEPDACPVCDSPFGDDAATPDQRLDVVLCITCASGYDENRIDISDLTELQ